MIEVRLLQVLAARPKGESSLYWLEKKTGVTYNTLHAFAKGKRESVFFATLDAICKTLGCQTGDIVVYVPGRKTKASAQK
jgi:putative transcriptional regulator